VVPEVVVGEKCGLKQGDPLAPFLIILVMESLHLSVTRAVNDGIFKGLRITVDVARSHGGDGGGEDRPLHTMYPAVAWVALLTERQTSKTQEYPSLIDTFFVAHTVNGEFLRDEDRCIYEEMKRLEATGTYTDDEINRLARGGLSRMARPLSRSPYQNNAPQWVQR
nr:RNA-directed DNA polymerase, eukaryota [Tanacetum cinerariifolium]